MPSAHHKYSASSAHRWMRCALSIALEANEPDTESEYAAEGTAVHHVAEQCANARSMAWDWLGQEVNGVEITEDHVTGINDYVMMLMQLEEEHDGVLYIEQPVVFGDAIGEPGAFGTPDAYLISGDGKTVVIADRKFKWGKRVSAEYNAQLMLYALGVRQEAIDMFGFAPERYVFKIHQYLEGASSVWECGDDQLEDLARDAKDAIFNCSVAIKFMEEGEDYLAYANPGEDTCRYCKAKATCPALRGVVEKAMENFPEGDAKSATLNVEALAAARDLVPLVESWAKAVTARVSQELHSGTAIPGWKLVLGKKGNRKWEDEEAVVKQFKNWRFKDDEMYKRSLLTPAQMEKLVKNDKKRHARFCELVTQADVKPTVAPANDPREAVIINRDADFENLDNEEL